MSEENQAEMPQDVNKKRDQESSNPPVMVMEYSFTVSRILLITVTFVTAVFSLLSGCPWTSVVLRAGTVALVLGFILYGLNVLIVDGTLDVIFQQVAELREQKEHATTQEWKV